jgi:hypothetical protein
MIVCRPADVGGYGKSDRVNIDMLVTDGTFGRGCGMALSFVPLAVDLFVS